MSTALGIILLIVVGPYLASRVGQARNAAWTGPRTPAMRGRAMRAPAPRSGTVRKAARSAGSAAAHPGSRQIRAQARADAFAAWQQAFAANYLEEQRHARQSGTVNGQVPAEPRSPSRSVPGHEAAPSGPVRRAATALIPAAAWGHLPGRAQGALCGCAICRGEKPHEPAANGRGPASPPPAPPRPSQIASSNGGTPVAAGTSTASAEKLIEGINQIHAHAAAGGINAKREAVKAIHEGLVRFAAMLAMLSRQMSEPGMNYGPEITEPLAQAGTHCQAAAMSDSEADAALSTLINMTVGDLATSPRRAPNHEELSETGAR